MESIKEEAFDSNKSNAEKAIFSNIYLSHKHYSHKNYYMQLNFVAACFYIYT